MKLLLWHWGRRGGGPRYTLELARALKARCSVALSLSRQSELFEETCALGVPGFHVETYAGLSSAMMATLNIPLLRRRFRDYLAAEAFDVVVSTMHHVWSPAFVSCIGASGAKLISVIHDADPHPGDPVLAWRFMLGREIAASAGVVALSDHVARILESRFSLPRDRLWVIPHGAFGFGSTAAQPRRFPIDRPLRISFFGRIKAYKGLGLLLNAIQSLRPEHCVALTIAGQGDLEPYAAQLQTLGDVRILNHWIPESDVHEILAQSDLVVAPYVEASQSGVIPSAYSSALPVVATPVGGLVEQVRHGETGLVANASSATALAEAIRRMITDPMLYERCSLGALEEARSALSWERVADAYLSAARTLLKGGGCRSGVEDRCIDAE